MSERARLAQAFICEDTTFQSFSLSAILRDAGCEAIVADERCDLDAMLDALLPPPDIMIVPVRADASGVLEMVRNRDWLRMVPILAIGTPDCSGLDLWRLRGFGVVGLVDRRSTAEHVRFRVEQVIGARSFTSRHARVSCCFLVDVAAAGEVSAEFAVSFSMGGIGLASARPLEPNTPVRLWLPVAAAPEGRVDVNGRVVRNVVRADGRYDVGIAFLELPDGVRDIVAEELRSLLVASGAQLGPSAASIRSWNGEAPASPELPSCAADPTERPGAS